MARSSLLVATLLEGLVALLFVLLMLFLAWRNKSSGRPLTAAAGRFIAEAKGPMGACSIAIAIIVVLGYVLPAPNMGLSAAVAFIVAFSVFAIVPAWLPSVTLFAVATVALFVSGSAAFGRLLAVDAEGPDAMAVGILMTLFYLLFFASCAVRLMCEIVKFHARRRSVARLGSSAGRHEKSSIEIE